MSPVYSVTNAAGSYPIVGTSADKCENGQTKTLRRSTTGSKRDPSWSCGRESARERSGFANEDYLPLPFPYKRILCPVDFDQNSAEALKEAAALALSGAGMVIVLHVVQINPLADMGAAEGFAAGEMYEDQIEFARKGVERILSALPSEVAREVLIEIGEPRDKILAVQAERAADLVVMATHGRRGLSHLVIGSVAEKTLRESRVPVLTVRPAHHGQATE